MATKVQRSKNIIEAFKDSVPTEETLDKILDAYAFTENPNNNFTRAEKATIFIKTIRTSVREVVKYHLQQQAIQTALQTINSSVDIGED